ncbi:MAG: hypothetical protein ACOC33_00070 [bacterium]
MYDIKKNCLSYFVPNNGYVYLTSMSPEPIEKEFKSKNINYSIDLISFYSVTDKMVVDDFVKIFKLKLEDLKYNQNFYNEILERKKSELSPECENWNDEYLLYKDFIKETLNIFNYIDDE